MHLKLVAPNDPALRTRANKVSDPKSLGKLSADLIETMIAEGGVGLAAPQVGTSARIFVTGVDKDYRTFINPEITWRSDETIVWEEGCLSLPRLLGNVTRPKKVTVKAYNAKGKRVEVTAEGLLGRVLQHELDHLDGILFPDRMDDLSSLRTLSEEEWETRYEAKQEGQSVGKQIAAE